MIAIRHASFVLLVIGLLVPTGSGVSQELEKFEQQYLQYTDTIVFDWNNKKSTFSKTEEMQKIFLERLIAFKQRQEKGQIEKIIPVEFVMENWDKRIPDVLVPELPLSKGAQMILAGSLLDAAKLIGANNSDSKLEQLNNSIQFPLLITLTAAQEEAKEAGDTEITAIAIRRGGLWFFSLGWPFCCAEN
jgi:hypothetical protein